MKIGQKSKQTDDSGFSNKVNKGTAPIFNKDGSTNVVHINRNFTFDDLYSYLIEISWLKFFGYVLLGYVLLNTIFGLMYLAIGIDEFTLSTGSLFYDFLNGFFFSAQTVTTVGYGSISPSGILGNVIATFEALIGLLSFSFITGLLYGRFSKPRSSISFSENIVLRDFKEHKALMFRLMNNRRNVMIEPQIHVTLSINDLDADGKIKRSFYILELERNQIMYLPTMWTVVHPIDQNSPLVKYTEEEMKKLDADVYVMINYHEESFSQKVYQMYSYSFKELLVNKKFAFSYQIDEEGNTIVDHDALNEIEEM